MTRGATLHLATGPLVPPKVGQQPTIGFDKSVVRDTGQHKHMHFQKPSSQNNPYEHQCKQTYLTQDERLNAPGDWQPSIPHTLQPHNPGTDIYVEVKTS